MEQWYVLHTKPHKELMVRQRLEDRGIRTYLPLLANGRGRGQARGERPFFARYLFARLDLGQVPLSSINWSEGMVGVVSFGGQPSPVDDQVIHWLQRRLAQVESGDYLDGLPLVPGTRLRVVTGPLAGAHAIFDRRASSTDRARVLIHLLGRLTACEVSLDALIRL